MSGNREHKFSKVDLKELTDDGEFEGYASVFGQRDQGDDVVQKGAFRGSLTQRKPKMLFQHDPSQPIGMWTDVREDDYGLLVRGRILSKVARGAEVLELMRAKVLDGLSIGYRTLKASRDERSGVRTLMEVDLWEISVVTFPMLPSATIDAVKGEWTKRDVERVLREAGMPNSMAVKLISGGWDTATRSKSQRDAGAAQTDLLASLRAATQLMKG